MRIGIIGSGISGLVAARLLSGAHEVCVLEAADYIGGHTHTVDVEVAGERHAIDTGFVVFNESTYPNFVLLLGELGVSSQPTNVLSCHNGATTNKSATTCDKSDWLFS
jgi:predicted NAD/FAD-binding protein